MEPALSRASEDALIHAAISEGEKPSAGDGVRDWTTSFMRVLGLRERMMLGDRSPLKDVASALDSVPGSDDSGRTLTSTVALDGCSATKRTSMGPEIEARDCVSPVDTIENVDTSITRSRTYRSQTVPIHLPCPASRRLYAGVLYHHFLAHRLGKKASGQKAQTMVQFNVKHIVPSRYA